MKLWLLRPVEGLAETDDPWGQWDPFGDKAYGFVVRAETEADARRMANECGGDENRCGRYPWLASAQSTCVELLTEGNAEVVLEDARNV